MFLTKCFTKVSSLHCLANGDVETQKKNAFPQGIAHVGDKIDLNLWSQKVFFLCYSREKAETQKQTKMFSWLQFKKKYRIASYLE